MNKRIVTKIINQNNIYLIIILFITNSCIGIFNLVQLILNPAFLNFINSSLKILANDGLS